MKLDFDAPKHDELRTVHAGTRHLQNGATANVQVAVQGAGGSLDVARLVREGGPFSRRVAFGVLGLGAVVYGLHRMRGGKAAGPRGHSRLKTAAKLALL